MSWAIECTNVTKRYGEKTALRELTLKIPTGCVAGILGANGAGKSTLFRMIMGLVRQDRGEVSVLGKQPGYLTNGQIAYLPDRARWYQDHTVRKAIQWGNQFLPEFDREEAEQFASIMKLDLDQKVDGLSKGQEARLMLILCLSRNVPLVILDEPFSGIDTLSREQIIEGLIEHISVKQQTVLISTHEIYEAEGLFDFAVFLDQGQVVLEGDSEALRRKFGSLHSIPRKLAK